MAEALVTGILKQLGTIAAQTASQQLMLVTGVREEVKSLESRFAAIKCVLEDAEEKQFTNKSIGNWLKKLKDVSYDMEDLLDEWQTAIGHPLAKYAALVMSGMSLNDLNFTKEVTPQHVSVKEAVLPFEKFQGCDVLLGPEMRSTGEVMGIDFEFAIAFAKAQIAAGEKLPMSGTVFINLNDLTKPYLDRAW
ncbi:hypothetical protein CCACVL1_17234 [Corchorus capsularis]|uniref:Disease resistance N-terminal domain-containing protein n=1 Tax=Corchorus capsularis TaxID=210143 RepID=A0A1R3HTG9_COCAP|nr:hypothetical protein CCACVL1_17234 [Corchorus capsularis]